MSSTGASDPQSRIWIVLVQKSAKGPFTYAEVCELLEKGIIRRNDPALRLGNENGKASGSWKLLWQYPEFDRRGEAAVAATAPAAFQPPREGERRKSPEENPPELQVAAVMPEDLSQIQPEDLIHHSSRELRRSDTSMSDEASFNAEELARSGEDEPGMPRWLLVMLVVSVGMIAFGWFSRMNPLAKKKAEPRAEVRADDEYTTAPAFEPRTLSSRPNIRQPGFQRPMAPRPPPAVELPPQRDPEPYRREESRYDRAADSDLQRDAERGEIRDDERNDRGEEEEGEREAPGPKRKRAPAAKEAVSEESEDGTPISEPNGETNAGPGENSEEPVD